MSNILGTWGAHAAEQVLRICNILAVFTSLLITDKQKFIWYSDNDLINEDGKKRKFSDTQMIFLRVLALYAKQGFASGGFGKSFKQKSHLDDLLSVPDLAAGVIQDLLQEHHAGEELPRGDEKTTLMKWIATPTRYLSKITLQIVRTDDGGIGTGVVDFARRG